jgi:hypothetical protein
MSRPITHAAQARRRKSKGAANHPSDHSHDSQKPPRAPGMPPISPPKIHDAAPGHRNRGVAANHRRAAVKRRTLILAYQDRIPIAQSVTGQLSTAPRGEVPAVPAQQSGTPTQAAPVGRGGGR